ncbi:MAG TPA: exosortase-associated EpsI family protein [Armatimonadaceae bacterium]|nr:exosortase-associated EpsI family protein [Armatimonadaceae bacterium]
MSNVRRAAGLLNLILAVALVVTLAWKPAPPEPFSGIPPEEVPQRLGGFVADGEAEVAPEAREALAAASILSRYYRSDSDADVAASFELLVIGGTDRSALHDPRSCFVGAGWEIRNDRTEKIPGTPVEARACQIVDAKTGAGFDALYLYVVDGKVIHRVTDIRAQMFWSAVIGKKNRPVYFVRMISPLMKDEVMQARQHEELLKFAAATWDSLDDRLQSAPSQRQRVARSGDDASGDETLRGPSR